MQELEYIKADLDKLHLGFDREYLKHVSWNTYTDSWKMIDGGEINLRNLPLYAFRVKYYSSLPESRLNVELGLLNIRGGVEEVAEGWVKRHVELYKSIKKFGFKPKARDKPMTVRIADDGILEVTDGNNTISILKHLKYPSFVYMKVSSRSQEWSRIRENLRSFYGKKMLYQPCNHPDFADWEIARECEDRWRVIEPALGGMKDRRILDIGCNGGWFSRKMVGKGAKVIGADPDRISLNLARSMSVYHGFNRKNPEYVNDAFENVLQEQSFDYAIMLSVIHHYIRKSPREAWSALNQISRRCKCLILEVETGNLPIQWNPELVLKHTLYKEYKVLSEKGRPIYIYW